jgi:hypothetical protein
LAKALKGKPRLFGEPVLVGKQKVPDLKVLPLNCAIISAQKDASANLGVVDGGVSVAL